MRFITYAGVEELVAAEAAGDVTVAGAGEPKKLLMPLIMPMPESMPPTMLPAFSRFWLKELPPLLEPVLGGLVLGLAVARPS